jgi:hypothetical protein
MRINLCVVRKDQKPRLSKVLPVTRDLWIEARCSIYNVPLAIERLDNETLTLKADRGRAVTVKSHCLRIER